MNGMNPISSSTLPAQDAVLVNPDDIPVIKEFLPEARGFLEAAETQLAKLEESTHDADAVDAIFRAFHTIKGVAGFLNLQQIGTLAHSTETLLAQVRSTQSPLRREGIDLVLQAIDVMNGLLRILEIAAEQNTPIAADSRVTPFLARLEDWSSESPRQVIATPVEEKVESATLKNDSATSTTTGAQASAKTTMRVSTDRLDSLINMVGELAIAQAMINEDVAALSSGNPRLGRNISHLSKICRNLQDLSLSMRMVPVRGPFQKMFRLVRDLAMKSGKSIELITEGEETEIDRNLVEAIEDPLMHLIRNAIDHGIEDLSQRTSAGKPPTGQIILRARHQAGHIVIEISDDGRGLDTAQILEKAVAAGLVDPDREMTPAEIYRLIFHAGLSTARNITDVSGRGVGMDVVKRNIEQVRGRIDIQSTPGAGATFTLRLPLTLALIDGLLVRVGDNVYIVPLSSVEESIQLKPHQISTVHGRTEMCMVRNSLLPVCRLHQTFAVEGSSLDALRGVAVIVHDGTRRCCVLVDELLGQQQVVVKPLGEETARVRGIAGGAILGNGNVSLILDIPTLLDLPAGSETLNTKEMPRECVNQ